MAATDRDDGGSFSPGQSFVADDAGSDPFGSGQYYYDTWTDLKCAMTDGQGNCTPAHACLKAFGN
jgi:hypothetical protein